MEGSTLTFSNRTLPLGMAEKLLGTNKSCIVRLVGKSWRLGCKRVKVAKDPQEICDEAKTPGDLEHPIQTPKFQKNTHDNLKCVRSFARRVLKNVAAKPNVIQEMPH